VALAAAVTIAAVVATARGLLYVAPAGRAIVLGDATYLPGPAGSPQHPLGITLWALLGVMATTVPLAFRRTYPAAGFAVILAAFIATSRYATVISVGAVILAAYSAVAYSKHRRRTLLALLAGAVVTTVVYPGAAAHVSQRYTPLLVLLPTVAVGNMMRMWRERAGESSERLRLAQAQHEAEKQQAVMLERARIASELHDVVTHNVSVMLVQAGAARRLIEATQGGSALAPQAELARDALVAVEASGRTAMTDLRHMLGLLAPAEEHAGAGAGQGGSAPGPASTR
jgi:signal transduction histidine kinase